MSGCAEARELLETAALEQLGIERLEAGDTVEAARVAGHLAICPPCAEELARLRRTAATLRAVLAEGPQPALRERTLALVRAAGVERGPAPGTQHPGAAGPGPSPVSPADLPSGLPRRAAGPAWLAAVAAMLVVGAFGAGFVVGGPAAPAPAATAGAEPVLARVAAAQARIMDAPDAVEVVLTDTSGVPSGMLAVAPSSGEMVAVAGGLAPAPEGAGYRCWMEVDGQRTVLGSMYLAGDVGWWAGPVALAGPIVTGTRFGVSLVGPDGAPADPVLLGSY